MSSASIVVEEKTLSLPPLNLPDWLATQSLYPKVYWKSSRDVRTFAALGQLFTLSHIPDFSRENYPFRLFGGLAFSATKKDPLWNPFPRCQFWLPHFEISQTQEYTTLQNHSPEDAQDEILRLHPPALEKRHNTLLARTETPNFALWTTQVHAALRKIENGELEKVVLAKRTILEFKDPLNPWAILKELQKKNENASLFAFQMDAEHTFLGASPEKLYTRRNQTLMTEALAGTRKRGADEAEDLLLENQLLHDPKERREFDCVKRSIHTTLSPLCSSMQWEASDHILKTSTVQHLHNQMRATLLPHICDATLLSQLHPTPAIGGLPRDQALTFLLSQEEFDRGWYASPLGWISADEADITVGIRSALIAGTKVHLFAGTGIVAGSDPQREWEELEHKISRFLQVLL
jgi:menaquinone-specific isochorismate synthase